MTTTDPCSASDSFAAMTVPELMSTLNGMYCANNSTSVGFKFLGYVLNLVDTNKDGVISCAEYNTDQPKGEALKKKPACPISPNMKQKKLKNTHVPLVNI